MNVIEPVFVEFIPEVLENGKLYISEEYKTAIHLCPCGCGVSKVTPLGDENRADRIEWTLIKHDNGEVSLSPSIGNRGLACGSHYWIKYNKIIW